MGAPFSVAALPGGQHRPSTRTVPAVCDGKVWGLTTLHEAYLKEMALEGIPSRRSDAPTRTEAKNHGSVHGYQSETLSKAWKDAAYGAVLLIDPERDGIVQMLTDAGVAESPLGRVPKQNPDRTV